MGIACDNESYRCIFLAPHFFPFIFFFLLSFFQFSFWYVVLKEVMYEIGMPSGCESVFCVMCVSGVCHGWG